MGESDRYSGGVNPEFLAHYGVKGMKWGVIRDAVASAKRPSMSRDTGISVAKDLAKTKVRTKEQAKDYVKTAAEAKRVKEIRLKQKVVGVQSLSNKDLQEVITRMNLEMTYKNLKKAEFEDSYLQTGGRFVGEFMRDVGVDVAASWLKRPGSNASGRTTRRVSSSLGSFNQTRAIGS